MKNTTAKQVQSLNFNTESLFEYIEYLLQKEEIDLFDENAEYQREQMIRYLTTTDFKSKDDFAFDLEAQINQIMYIVSRYAYQSGFTDACQLYSTLQAL